MTSEEKNLILEPNDLTKLLEGYEDKWVIIASDNSKILASGSTLGEIAAHIPEGDVMKVPRFDSAFIY